MKRINLDSVYGATAALLPLLDESISAEEFATEVLIQIGRLALDPDKEECAFLASQSLLWRKVSDSYMAQANGSENVDVRKKFFTMGREASIEARESLRMLNEARARILREQRRTPDLEASTLVLDVKRCQEDVYLAKTLQRMSLDWAHMTPEEQAELLDRTEKFVTWCVLFHKEWREQLPKPPEAASERHMAALLAWTEKHRERNEDLAR